MREPFPALSARGWILNLGGATGLAASASVFTLVASALILRVLPLAEAGQYAFLTAFVPWLAIIGGLGQSGLVLRQYSMLPPGQPDWQSDLAQTILVCSPVIALAIGVAAWIYHLPGLSFAFVATSVPLVIASQVASSQLDSHRQFVWGSLFIRLPSALMVLPAGLALLSPAWSNLRAMLLSQVGALGLTLALATLVLVARMPRGRARLTLAERRHGVPLGILAATHQLIDQGLLAIAAIVLAPESIAAYAALALFIRPVFLLHSVVLRMLVVETSRDPVRRRERLLLAVWVAAVIITLLLIAILPPVSHIVYAGRYDSDAALALPIALTAGLLLTELFPRSYLTGPAPRRQITLFAACQAAITGAGIALILVLARWWGVQGVAWAGATIAMLRNIVAYPIYSWARRGAVPTSS